MPFEVRLGKLAKAKLPAGTGVMARYHFQVRTETHVMLTEALDLLNADEARLDAARRVGVLLQDHAGKLWADENWQMDVTDERGLILFAIFVQAVQSTAVPQR